MSNYYFTITAGRTGTAWLADFIKNNLQITSIHEQLGIDDFGVQMPDIKTMRMFNDRGLNDFVIEFWKRKFNQLEKFENYDESNHTLAKCGLLEFAANYQEHNKFTFFCLRRNHVKQCISYINRGDFQNITISWQWYLHYGYNRKIVDPAPLLKLSGLGAIIWYIFEIEARQEYYKILYGDRFKFIDLTLERITQPDGAKLLLEAIGSTNEPMLGKKRNQNVVQPNHDLERKVEDIFRAISFDPKQLASDFVSKGNRLV